MRPYRIQWQNTGLSSKPWFDFRPDLRAVATSEGGAIAQVEGTLRAEHEFMTKPYPLRAVEISWDDYQGIYPTPT